MKKNKLRKLLFFLSAIAVSSYLSVFISPIYFWPIGLVNYMIPVLLFLLVVASIFTFFRNRKLIWIPLLSLAVGFYFIDITFNLPLPASEEAEFTVLSFNARYFRERTTYSHFRISTINWAVEDDSDIKCFQEFSTRPSVPKTDVIKLMKENGYHVYSEALRIEGSPHSPGLAICSKFPIVNTGLILLNESSVNNCIFADIAIHGDTIRVYNFHLKSMGLELHKLKNPYEFRDASKTTASKLGSASSKRAHELDIILNHVEQSRYPFILACDFNELIYGNNYLRVRHMARDTFEEAGSGFGFTFNSFLFFIRLDHQFFSEGIEAVDLDVIKDIKSSDHFPLKGYYRLNP